MRPLRLLLAASLAAALACSSSSSPSSSGGPADASSAPPAQGSTSVGCTAAGGTCLPYTSFCPLLQQNLTLCGDSIRICCLPPSDASLFVAPESGTGGDAGPASDAGVDTGSAADTGAEADAGSAADGGSGTDAAPPDAGADGAAADAPTG